MSHDNSGTGAMFSVVAAQLDQLKAQTGFNVSSQDPAVLAYLLSEWNHVTRGYPRQIITSVVSYYVDGYADIVQHKAFKGKPAKPQPIKASKIKKTVKKRK
jgi:hypothetical protein